MSAFQAIVLLVALQRLAELIHSRRNERRLLARGGFEVGARHYPVLVAVHLAWLAALWFGPSAGAPVNRAIIALYLVLQAGRYWVIASLGENWTTRIITVPGRTPVRTGPYRWLRHPNYVIVACEIALLPLAVGAWRIALAFTALNGLVLAHRIRIENAALSGEAPAAARPADHGDFYGN